MTEGQRVAVDRRAVAADAVVEVVVVGVVVSRAKDLAHRSRVEAASQEVGMRNLGAETYVVEEVGIQRDHRKEEADIDSCHIQEEVEDTGACEDTLEIAVSAVEEQKSTNQ